jgi:outer membrane protein TolC
MKIVKIIVVFCLSIMTVVKPTALPQPASRPEKLTMEEAVSRSLAYRPDLEAFYYAVEQGKYAAKEQLSGYYPKIQLTSYLSQTQHQDSFKNGTQMRGDQLIYSWAGPLQAYRLAKKMTHVTESEREVQEHFIRYTVQITFLDTYIKQQQQNKFSHVSDSSKATYKRSRQEKNVDMLDKKDWLRRVENHAVDAAAIEGYSFDLNNAHKKLEFLVGTTLIEEKVLSKKTKEKKYTFTTLQWEQPGELPENISLKKCDEYIDMALKSRPEIKRESKKIEVQDASYSLHKGQRLPTIAAYGKAGFDNQRMIDSGTTVGRRGDYEYHEYGLTMKWSLFDGLTTHYQEQQDRVGKLKAMLDREQTIINIKDQVTTAFYDVSNALTQCKAQKVKYTRAKNDFELNDVLFKQGLITDDVYKQGKTDWESAQLDWVTINVIVAVKEKTLAYYCGYPANF